MNSFPSFQRFHTKRKCYFMTTCLALIIFTSVVSGRPPSEDDVDNGSNNKWTKINDIKHPVVYYKEDYVSADYDPAKELAEQGDGKNSSTAKLLKLDQKYFDYYPLDNAKLENKETDKGGKPKIDFEIYSIYDPQTGTIRTMRHKHAHKRTQRRTKRQTAEDPHGVFANNKSPSRQRRQYYTPYTFSSYPQTANPWNSQYIRPQQVLPYPSNYYLPVQSNYVKYPIKGIYYNPITLADPVSNVPEAPVNFGNRLGDDDDDRPIWGIRYENSRPSTTTNVVQPTRRPSPPLLHGGGSNTNEIPTTRRPSPPLLHGGNSNNNPPPRRPEPTRRTTASNGRDNNNNLPPPTQAPIVQTTRRPAATRRPAQSVATTPAELSRCVWAIVSCCSRNNPNVRYQCFEQMGCQGAFWDLNPCANEIQNMALDAAENYFD